MTNKKLKYFKLNLKSSDKVAQFRAYFKRLNSVKFSKEKHKKEFLLTGLKDINLFKTTIEGRVLFDVFLLQTPLSVNMQKYLHLKKNNTNLNAGEDKNLNSATDLNAGEDENLNSATEPQNSSLPKNKYLPKIDKKEKESLTDVQQKENKQKENIKKQIRKNIKIQQKNFDKKLLYLNFQKSKKDSINLNSNIENTIPILTNPRTKEYVYDNSNIKLTKYNKIEFNQISSEGFQNRKRKYSNISKFSFRNTNEFPIEIQRDVIPKKIIPHYFVFDIETALVSISYNNEPELTDLLGNFQCSEIYTSIQDEKSTGKDTKVSFPEGQISSANLSANNVDDSVLIQIPVMIGITKENACKDSTQQIIENSKQYTTIFTVNSIPNSNKDLLQESIEMMNKFWDHINDLSQNYIQKNQQLLDNFKEEKQHSDKPIPKPALDYMYIYAHNLGKFDGVFLVKSFLQCNGRKKFKAKENITMKNNTLIRMKVGKYIIFLDSLQLMNQKLDTLGKIMLNVPKLDIGYKYFSRELLQGWKKNSTEWNNFENYLARDCVLLINIINILAKLFLENYKIILGVNSTISAIANKIYFSKYYVGPIAPKELGTPVDEDEEFLNNNENEEDTTLDNNENFSSETTINSINDKKTSFWSLTTQQDTIIRESFTGGRCEVFIPYITPVYSYDINSAFCAAMAYEDMPTGKPMGPIKINDPLGFFLYQFDSFFGFIHCTVYSPADMSIIPPLFFRSLSGRILYPLGTFSGTYFSEELKKAKEVGFIIIPHSYIKFNRNKEQFKGFIEETYQNRISHKKNTPENFFYKILMLSVYGRFALNPRAENLLIEDKVDVIFKKYKYYPITDITSFKDINNEIVYLGRVGPTPSVSSTYGSPHITSIKASKLRIAPQVASAISSYVRVKIYNILNGPLKGKIAYTDTDSIFATEPLEESYISDLELGKWKYEGKFDIGIFIAKKLYNLLNSSKDVNKEKNNLNNISSGNLSENLLEANRDSMLLANINEEAYKDEDTINNLNTKDVTLNQILEQNKIIDFSDFDSLKYAAKGIPPNYYNQIKQEDWWNMLNKKQFTKLLEGNVTNNAIRMERDFITGLITVLSPNINISNSSVDNSRLRIFDKNNKWVNTKPLLVNENSKISLVDYHIIRRDKEKQIKDYKKTNTKKKYFYLLKQEIDKRKLENKQKDYLMNILKMFKAKYFNKSSSSFKQLPKDQLFTTYQMNSYKLEVLIILRILDSINELTQVSLKNVKNQLETLVRDDLRKFDQDYEKYIDFLLKKSSGKDTLVSFPEGQIIEDL